MAVTNLARLCFLVWKWGQVKSLMGMGRGASTEATL